MEIKDFETRCYEEYYAKNPKVAQGMAIFFLLAPIILFIGAVAGYVACLGIAKENWEFFAVAFGFLGGPFLIYFTLRHILIRKFCSLPYTTIKKAKADKSYVSYSRKYPYSILYPGELYPFDQTAVQPVSAPAPAAAPAPVATPAPAAAPAQPEQVMITCGNCGQPMLIPMTSGAFRITCPKCGNSFIHTN